MENNQQQIIKQGIGKRKLAVILVAILVVAIAAASAAAILANSQLPSSESNGENNQTNSQVTTQSWIKKGAYATYQGQATIMSMSISFDAKMEIVDLNETHMQILTDYNMSTPFGATQNSTTAWVSRENMTFQSEDLELNRTYSTQVTIPNLGTRTCTVYEYSSEGISAAYYVDNVIQWPIKMVMTSPEVGGQSYNMDINLVDSNIPGL